ncbi:flagellar basal body L-ring protein FlgH [Rhodobacteraceae bacterium Araon29]
MNNWNIAIFVFFTASCGQSSGSLPAFSSRDASIERQAMLLSDATTLATRSSARQQASLWSRTRNSLLGDRRALRRGDILTVLIEIDDKAEISNSSSRARNASDSLSLPDLFGIPQRFSGKLPDAASYDRLTKIDSKSTSSGDGSIKRKEKLTLRVAVTIIETLPNGVLFISGSQEIRVNQELRELLVSGFVRPEDISRKNQITYDKIASARVSYGGRGHISDAQQPRVGFQILDDLSPF